MVTVIIGCFVLAILCFVVSSIMKSNEVKREKEEIEKLLNVVEEAISESGVRISNWEQLKSTCRNSNLEYTKNIAIRVNRVLRLTIKYKDVLNTNEVDSLIDGRYFLGMTEQMLIDSAGEPTKIEEEVMKTKTKITYIYGTKHSGDTLVFENGKLVRFKDK